MVLLTLNVSPRDMIDIEDYGTLIKKVLELDISFNIIHFSTSSKSVSLIIEVPKEKVKPLKESLKGYNILIERKEPISIDEELCINCGQCIALCSTSALHFDDNDKVCYDSEKCIGCLLCVDSCPRGAILENI
ncbi:MAG: 4Fe-4S dicluster domain-containing protein [Candidatus Lokiarchaeota archaeon]|nr:4Fe-4S dicluster domain-containing protein [Candidatus Lokiarchaeota archaeon]